MFWNSIFGFFLANFWTKFRNISAIFGYFTDTEDVIYYNYTTEIEIWFRAVNFNGHLNFECGFVF